ncbi:hypothetical protein PVAND_017342 [Polypedilum vanderplanki]|uniref:Uncharacterized protein n=1 Tax=Polypedilum vanderplanki TaxID=319348 RepID=A0A9J6BIR7_POLVA|nr:hypothetical protein PVAND_017342 [Polypedilum vanderplanki]
MKFLVEKCCYCVDLEMFGYTLGWLGVVGNIFSIIDIWIKNHGRKEKILYKPYERNIYWDYSDNNQNEPFETVLLRNFLPWMGIIISMSICVCWLYGIYKKKHRFMLTFLVMTTIGMIIIEILILFYTIQEFLVFIEEFSAETFFRVILMIIILVIPTTFLCYHIFSSLLSLFNKIRNEEEVATQVSLENKGQVYYRPENAPVQNV